MSSAPFVPTPVPPKITTPSPVETRIGTLNFFDGVPDAATTAMVYDNLDFLRGVEAFLNGVPGASLVAIRRGLRGIGATGSVMGVYETLMDSRSIFLTANTETIYCWNWMDLKNGPVVVESPPNVLGVVDDFWFRYVTDIGNAGPDKGKGGKYLLLPPDHQGETREGYFTFKCPTYGNLLFMRGYMVKGDTGPGVANVKAGVKIYPLANAADPPPTTFINMSGMALNTVHANDITFYEELNEIIQEEPLEAYGPDMMGLFAAIGLKKGQPFKPDDRMRKLLTDAVAVANATARAIVFRNRDPEALIYPDRQWRMPFVGASYEWLTDGWRNFDARTMFFYAGTVDTPAMAVKMVGVGSQYAFATGDANGDPFDGSKTYRLHVPANPPAKDFWSVVLYDTQSRSMLQTGQPFPGLNSEKGLTQNSDGSWDLYFAPEQPAQAANWIETVRGKSWFTIFRLYGPLEPWFDQSWKLPDIEPLN
jgi:hypothetical protein